MLNPAQTMAKLRRLSVGTTPEAQTAAQLLRELAEKYPEITADGEVVQRDLDVWGWKMQHGEVIRTIKGPCFDCDVRSCWCGWGDNDECACHSPMGERTAPIIKIEPDELRPTWRPIQ